MFDVKFEKRAKIKLSIMYLHELLKLPDDVIIVGADFDPNYNSVSLHLRGENKGLKNHSESSCTVTVPPNEIIEEQ